MILSTVAALVCLSTATPAKAQSSARASSGARVVVGKLGQATDAVPIFSAPSPRSRIYYRTKAYDYLVVRRVSGSAWTQVYMQNGRYGYVDAGAVAELPYQVTVPTRQSRTSEVAVSSRGATSVANYALNFIGTPYVWGGNDPNRGIDCSGFVKKMYGTIGVSLPRTAAEQARVGRQITRLENLAKGDRLYFWDAKRGKIGHTGIYLGNGYFVHASSGHHGVATDYLGEKRWLKILVDARR